MKTIEDPDVREAFEKHLREELDQIARLIEESREYRAPVVLDQQSVGRLSRMDAMQSQAMAQDITRRRRWQVEENPHRENGGKDRPVGMILTITDRQGLTHLLLLPISSKPPFDGQEAIEIPALELRRAKLTGYKRGWITISECNYDVLERSYYLDPGQDPVGRFSDAFLEEVRQAFSPLVFERPHPQFLRWHRENCFKQ